MLEKNIQTFGIFITFFSHWYSFHISALGIVKWDLYNVYASFEVS